MSDDDDPMDYYDESELESMMEGGEDEESLSPEDVFNMVTIQRKRKMKVTAVLKDAEGTVIELPDSIEKLMKFMKDKLEEEEPGKSNQFADQIFPLMSQSVASGLGRLIGIQPTAFIVGNDLLLHSTIHMMCLGFLLLKYVQNHNLTIHTFEEEVSDEELEEMDRKHKAHSITQMGAIMGMDPKDILKGLLEQGKITKKDLMELSPSTLEEVEGKEPPEGEEKEDEQDDDDSDED